MELSLRQLSSKLVSIGSNAKKIQSKSRVAKFDPALSGLRGLAAVGVVLLHEGSNGFISPPAVWFTDSLFIGVPIFLMLSMYLLLNRLDANTNLKHYFKRRIIRIWPIYYGTLVISYLLFPFPFPVFLRMLFFVQYYVNPFTYFPVAVFWTLQLEEAAYLFIPLIHRLKNKNLLGAGIVLGSLGYLTYITFYSSQGLQPMSTLQIFLPFSLLGYGFGLFAYTGLTNSKNLRWLSLFGILGMFSAIALNGGSRLFNLQAEYFIFNVLLYSMALVGFSSMLTTPPKFLSWFTFFGEESYALYAIHFAFVVLFGLVGMLYAIGLAFLIEFGTRPREIIKRFKLAYGVLWKPGMPKAVAASKIASEA